MQIKVCTIDFKVPQWIKRLVFYAVIPTIGFIGVSTIVKAAGSIKTDFMDGDILSAKEINENFKTIKDAINTPIMINPSQIAGGALPNNVTVTSASSCTTCGAANGALETRISAIESTLASLKQSVGGNFAEHSNTVVGLPTGPLIQVSLTAPSSGFLMAVATTRVCAFEGDIWLALSTKANDVPLVGRAGPYGFARAVPSEKYCESVTLSRTFPVQAGQMLIYLNVQASAANGPEFVAPTLSVVFYRERLE